MGKIALTKEAVENEIEELEADQHPKFYKNEQDGRERMSILLHELNVIENKTINPGN